MYKGCQTYEMQNAFVAYEGYLNLPCSVSLKEENMEFVVENIKAYFNGI